MGRRTHTKEKCVNKEITGVGTGEAVREIIAVGSLGESVT